jgi:hypothetical protein
MKPSMYSKDQIQFETIKLVVSMLSKLSSKVQIQVIKINLKLSHANDMLFKLKPTLQVIKINLKLNLANNMLSKLKPTLQVIKINLKLKLANKMLFKLSNHIYIQ